MVSGLRALLCLTVGAAVSLPGQQEAEGKEQHCCEPGPPLETSPAVCKGVSAGPKRK